MTPKGRSALLVRLICLGSALLWIVLVATDRGLLERFELAALDTELRLGPPSHASPDIIIVAVDERAVHRYGPLRWPPSRMAEIIAALDRAAPRVIAFDFAFSAEGEAHERGAAAGRPELQPLREAAKRSGKVVLGNYFDFDADPDGPPLPPDSGFREHRVRRLLYLGGARPAAAAPPRRRRKNSGRPSRPGWYRTVSTCPLPKRRSRSGSRRGSRNSRTPPPRDWG